MAMVKRITVCGGGFGLPAAESRCPNASEHTPHPLGYVAYAEWAEKMLLTHEQVRCGDCGLYAIWRAR